MVRATTSLEPTRKDLKSAPGGFVVIRQMTYGEYLHRRDLAMGMSVQGDLKQGMADRINIDMLQTAVTQYEFKTCILDHNLDDENGSRLPLNTPQGLQKLDPRIGQEIEQLLEELNRWEDPKSSEGVPDGSGEGSSVSEDSEPLSGRSDGDGDAGTMSGVPDITP